VIEGFLSRARLGHRVWSVVLALLGHGTVAVVLLLIAEILAPQWLVTLGACAAVWLSTVVVWTWGRSRAPLWFADRQLNLEDRLLTWAGPTRQRSDRAMVAWLERDLAGRLEKVDRHEGRRLLRRPLGRLRYLIPILLLLVFCRFMAIFLPSMLPGGEDEVARGGGDAATEARAPLERAVGQSPLLASEEPEQAVSQQSDSVPPPSISAPKPLIENIPAKDEFVIPAFLRDGEKRKALSKIAMLEEGSGGSAIASEKPLSRPELDPRRQPGTEEFKRSWEAAVRARNLPPSEREFVRAYFQGLIERGK